MSCKEKVMKMLKTIKLVFGIVLFLSGMALVWLGTGCVDMPVAEDSAGAAGGPAVGLVKQAYWSPSQGCYMFNTDPAVSSISSGNQRKAAVAIMTGAWGDDGSWNEHFWVRDQSQGVVGYQPADPQSLVFYARSSLVIGGCAGSPSRQTKTWTVMSCGFPDLAGCLNDIVANPNSNQPPHFYPHGTVSFSTKCNSDTLFASSVTVRIGSHTYLTQPWNGWGGFCEQ